MAFDPVFMARLYCAVVGAALIALGLAAWEAERENSWLGALLGGAGLFLVAGTFGRASRLAALLALCALIAAGACLSGLGYLLLSLQLPSWRTVGVLAVELLAALLALRLARRLLRA